MKNQLLILFLITSSFGFSQQTEKLNIDSLKIELSKFLVQKNLMSNLEEFTENNRGLYFSGIHKEKVANELKDGIYVFNNGSNHSLSFFVIIDGNSFTILDISTLQGLKDSIDKMLKFANKQNYCAEIIEDYISRLISVHYAININPNNRLDKNCEFDLKPVISTFNLISLKTKLSEFLVEKGVIKDIDQYLKYPNDLFVSKMDIYYGLDTKKNIESGVYTFAYLEGDTQNFYYFILNEDSIEIFEIESAKSLASGINRILQFTESQKYCHLKTVQIVKKLVQVRYTDSCLDYPIFDLP
jgi:hypothetical protein